MGGEWSGLGCSMRGEAGGDRCVGCLRMGFWVPYDHRVRRFRDCLNEVVAKMDRRDLVSTFNTSIIYAGGV